VAEVLEFLREFGPSPELCKGVDVDGGVVEPDPSGSLVATVFNVKADPHVGKVCLFRVFRGTLDPSASVVAVGSDNREEKIGGLFRMVGKKRENADRVGPGDIAAFSKVEKVQNRATFTTPGSDAVRIAVRDLPGPTVAVAVTPKSRADEQKIGEALSKLASEDPTIVVEHRPETHEMVVCGMSDLHLQVMEARLKRRFGVEITTAVPRIAYKETVTKAAEGHHRHKKQSGGRGQFGECYLRVRPVAAGAGVVFTDAVVGGSIPRNLIPAVEKGVRELAKGGILTQSQVVDVEIELYDGKFHAVDSDEASFKIAGARAFRGAFEKAGPVLLEPVMEVEIHVPTDHAGSIFSDITSQRRGHVVDQWNSADGAVTAIKAHVPLVCMQTYFRDLKSMTAGEGSYTMKMSAYQRVPVVEQQKVLAEFAKKHEDD
jgi:elongation factor G